MKLPYPCPKCTAPIMNYAGKCGQCGHEPPAKPAAAVAASDLERAARIVGHICYDVSSPLNVHSELVARAAAALTEARRPLEETLKDAFFWLTSGNATSDDLIACADHIRRVLGDTP